jgi:hypothetical protein
MLDWSKFSEDAEASTPLRGPRCSVGIMLDDLPEDARKAVQQAFDNRVLAHTGIRAALVKRLGSEAPSLFSISNHRRGNCKCGSGAEITITQAAS